MLQRMVEKYLGEALGPIVVVVISMCFIIWVFAMNFPGICK